MGAAGASWCNYRLFLAIVFAASITAAGLLGFHKPLLKGCIMTYMYPTYIPIPPPLNGTNNKYSLFLYHEGWKKIDYQLHLVKLSGVPVLFIPGNGGSYKQVSIHNQIFFQLTDIHHVYTFLHGSALMITLYVKYHLFEDIKKWASSILYSIENFQ